MDTLGYADCICTCSIYPGIILAKIITINLSHHCEKKATTVP